MIVHQISRPRLVGCGRNNFYVPLVTKTTYMTTFGAGRCGGLQRTWEIMTSSRRGGQLGVIHICRVHTIWGGRTHDADFPSYLQKQFGHRCTQKIRVHVPSSCILTKKETNGGTTPAEKKRRAKRKEKSDRDGTSARCITRVHSCSAQKNAGKDPGTSSHILG